MKSMPLSLKTIIKELNRWKKRFFVASKQINREKYVILTILKNTFYYL